MKLESQNSKPASGDALALGVALLGGMYLVARPLANQFSYYSPEAAFAGMLALLLLFVTGMWNIVAGNTGSQKQGCPCHTSLLALLALWAGMFLWGLLRSPYLGAGVPLCSDAWLYGAVLLSGFYIGRRQPAFIPIFARLLIAMVAVEAVAGIFQIHVDLPRLRHEYETGVTALPEVLQSKQGLDRFYGDEAFGTFGNPNSLAGYLLVGIFLLLGMTKIADCGLRIADWRSNSEPRPIGGGVPLANARGSETNPQSAIRNPQCWHRMAVAIGILLLLIYGLIATKSKGGFAACVVGAWFFAAQQIGAQRPRWRRALKLLTVAGLIAAVLVLAAGVAGLPGTDRLGLSMAVRFDFWRAGLKMFAQHPLEGVGLAGFAEHYPFFKLASGWETKDAHNEFAHLLAEFGVLGPLVYAGLWWMVLKDRVQGSGFRVQGTTPARTLEILAIAGGTVALILILLFFEMLNAKDLFALLKGNFAQPVVIGALGTLALPAVFVAVFFALRNVESDGATLFRGFRAAAGAVLLHQLVDFDFKVQAIMMSLLLLGGMFLGARENGRGDGESGGRGDAPQPSPPASPSPRLPLLLSYAILPLIAVILFLPAAWIPFFSGAARQEAEALGDQAREYKAPKPGEIDLVYPQLIQDLAAAHQEAVASAPFDAEPLIEYALFTATHSRDGDKAAAMFKRAIALRPYAANPRVLLGSYYLRRAAALSRGAEAAAPFFKQAVEWHQSAVAVYPLNPGLRLMVGDAHLLQGDLAAAEREYDEAFAIDMRIGDANVYLSSIFIDPRPGAFSRHGLENAVLRELNARPSSARGFLLRRVVALATLIREAERNKNAASDELRDELHATVRELVAESGADAHAALLYALSFEMTQKAEGRAEAWQEARRLQRETPGTPPAVFTWLDTHYGFPRQ